MAYLDDHGMVALEQCPWPGNIGDSCADSSRRLDLKIFIDPEGGLKYLPDVLNLYKKTRTLSGYVRHPDVPLKDEKGNNWREPDFSGDQWISLYRLLRTMPLSSVFFEVKEMEDRLKSNFFRYGNGDFAHPSTHSSISRGRKKHDNLTDFPTYAQSLLLVKFKYRWDDSHNAFRETENSSCDWLNQFTALMQAQRGGHTWVSEKAKAMLSADQMWEKVQHYWRNEPNKEYLLDDYLPAIQKLWA